MAGRGSQSPCTAAAPAGRLRRRIATSVAALPSLRIVSPPFRKSAKKNVMGLKNVYCVS